MTAVSSDLTTPGAYMRQCRQRAGKSRAECAAAIAFDGDDRLYAQRDLARLENDRPGDYGHLVGTLRDRKVFAFDFATFSKLAAGTADPALDPWGA